MNLSTGCGCPLEFAQSTGIKPEDLIRFHERVVFATEYRWASLLQVVRAVVDAHLVQITAYNVDEFREILSSMFGVQQVSPVVIIGGSTVTFFLDRTERQMALIYHIESKKFSVRRLTEERFYDFSREAIKRALADKVEFDRLVANGELTVVEDVPWRHLLAAHQG